jgi:hypothetical protein
MISYFGKQNSRALVSHAFGASHPCIERRASRFKPIIHPAGRIQSWTPGLGCARSLSIKTTFRESEIDGDRRATSVSLACHEGHRKRLLTGVDAAANAVFNATRKRVRDLPFPLDKVM